ncbi:kynureninase [Reyranella sp. CPCC 100927]|uniref:kynureninase n=1 Tax=Reyranella sp. CPCC 100927 TaxID=2599616 RepID=UPI0011B65298|nr:kynureninase [Reyranella sp. CPCC 100927]TWT09555.1 kynureninase [Reyranella sp. CPCC 100927]
MTLSRQDCVGLDAADPLASVRDRFVLPAGINYLDGNSLGALPRGVAERVGTAINQEWGDGLVRSWNAAGWYESPGRIGRKLAPLLGAAPHQVTVTDTISVNLFKLLVAAVRLRPGRKTIVAEAGNFPSDNHIVDSVARLHGMTVRTVPAAEVAAAVDDDTAVAELSHINYRTAEVQDMAAVSAAIQSRGALVVWDLAHSSGAVELSLDADRADFAVGCGYKFLNGGPGAPSHVYVAERHLAGLDQPLTGWFSHAAPFQFDAAFARAEGIRAMLCSTPQMLANVAFEVALDAFDGIAMRDVQAKGRALGDLMIRLYDERLAPLDCGLVTLRDGTRRGNHVSITHAAGYQVMHTLIARGIIGDFRAPDAMRFGFAPLYVRHVDVWDAVAAVEDILRSGAWRAVPSPSAGTVT